MHKIKYFFSWLMYYSPECSTWHKFPNPGGAISTKNVIFPIQGAQFWLKMSYFQPRAGGRILIKYVL